MLPFWAKRASTFTRITRNLLNWSAFLLVSVLSISSQQQPGRSHEKVSQIMSLFCSIFSRHVISITREAKALTKNYKTIHDTSDPHFPVLLPSLTQMESRLPCCSRNMSGTLFCIRSFFALTCLSSSIHMTHSLTLLRCHLFVRLSWLLSHPIIPNTTLSTTSLHHFPPFFSLSPFLFIIKCITHFTYQSSFFSVSPIESVPHGTWVIVYVPRRELGT